MTISTSSYFSNSIVGIPQVAGELVDVYASDATPKFALGTKFERQDGAVFRYAHFAGACTAGQVLASATTDVSFVSVSSSVISTSSTYQMYTEPLGVYPNGIGSRFIIIQTSAGNASAVANQYRGGYLTVSPHKNDGVYVAGQTYRVKGSTLPGNPVAAGSSLMRLELYDKLIATITTSAFIGVAGSKFNDLTPADDTIASGIAVVAGVAMNVQQAGYFGWVQSKGPVGIQLDVEAAGCSAGYLAVLGTNNIGSVIAVANLQTSGASLIPSQPIIGIVMSVCSSTQTAVVDVRGLE